MRYNHLFFTALGLMLTGEVFGQSYFTFDYKDTNGNMSKALLINNDDDEDSQIVTNKATYTCEKKTQKISADSSVTTLQPTNGNNIKLIWTWGKKQSEDKQRTPYVSLNGSNDPKGLSKAEHFEETFIENMDADFLKKFYAEENPEYKNMLAAHEIAKDNAFQSRALTYNNGGGQTVRVNQGSGVTMHIFILANTSIDDIGSACAKDAKNVKNEFNSIAKIIGATPKVYEVTGTGFSKSKLKSALNSLNPGSNDIVIFFYSGHGFRWDNQKDKYPMFSLVYREEDDTEDGNYVSFTDVYNAIKKKGARLNIMFSDCCNSLYGTDSPKPLTTNTLASRSNNNYSSSRLRSLFLESSGNVLSTAASPGEYSWCDQTGGAFTVNFISALRKEISATATSDPSWSHLVDKAVSGARKYTQNNMDAAQNGLRFVKLVNKNQ